MTPYDTFHGDQREDHSILASLSKTNKPLPEAPSTRPLASHRRHLHPGPGPTPPTTAGVALGELRRARQPGDGPRSGTRRTRGRDHKKQRRKGHGEWRARQGNHFGGRDDKGNQKTRSKNTLDETERTERPPSPRKTRVCKANRLNAFWEL